MSGTRRCGKRFQTSAELVAALDRLDEKGRADPDQARGPFRAMRSRRRPVADGSVGVWWYQRQFIPPRVRDPVSVVIADFRTGPAIRNSIAPSNRRCSEGWRRRASSAPSTGRESGQCLA